MANTTELPFEVFEPLIPDCLNVELTYDVNQAQGFDPISWDYYKEEVLPTAVAGIVFGALALLACLAFLCWIFFHFKHYLKCGRCMTCACCRKGKNATTATAGDLKGVGTDAQDTTTGNGDAFKAPADVSIPAAAPKQGDSSVAVEMDDLVKGDASTTTENPLNEVLAEPDLSTASAAADQTTTKAPGTLPFHPNLTPHVKNKHDFILLNCLGFFGLMTIVFCLWGIPYSLIRTNSQINEFWSIIDGVERAAAETATNLTALSDQLGTVQQAVGTIAVEADKLDSVLAPLGSVGDTIASGLDKLNAASDGVGAAQEALDAGVAAIEEYLIGSIDDIQNSVEAKTLQFSQVGRIIAITVVLGIIMILSAFAFYLCWNMRNPAAAAYVTCAVMFFVFLVLLFGGGVAHSMVTLSHDGCLYAETYVGNTALSQVDDPKKRDWLHHAVKFYLQPGEDTKGSAIAEITGIRLDKILDALGSDVTMKVLDLLTSKTAQRIMRLALSSATVDAINDLGDNVPQIFETLSDLDYLASRQNTYKLNVRVKELICCEVANAANQLFIAWVVIGSIAFVFSLLCAYRIWSYERARRREAAAAINLDVGQDGAAAQKGFDTIVAEVGDAADASVKEIELSDVDKVEGKGPSVNSTV